MPKVFDLRRFVEHSIEHKTPDEIIILSCLTWVPEVLGKTKEEIGKIEYMRHGQISDEWFIECEEGTNGTSQHSTLQN